MPPFVKQYGYYRCGTNFTYRAVDANFDCHFLVNTLGCKHESTSTDDWVPWMDRAVEQQKTVLPELRTAVEQNDVRVIVTMKDPYAWLSSFLLYMERRAGRCAALAPDRLPHNIRKFSDHYILWSEMARKPLRHLMIRYEDMLEDYEGALNTIGDALVLKRSSDEPVSITKRMDAHAKTRGKRFDPSFFLERRYMDDLAPKHLKLLKEHINWDFFNQYGYTCVDGG